MSDFSTLQTATKEHASIGTANTSFDTQIKRWLNDGQQDFTTKENWKFLEAQASITSSTYKFKYSMRDEVDVVRGVRWDKQHLLKNINHKQWTRLNRYDSTGLPAFYIITAGTLKIYPKSDKTPIDTTTTIATSATTDSLVLTSVANLEATGRIGIGTEVIEYANVDSTNNKITGCLRGREGTTPTNHAVSTAVSYRNLEYDYYKKLSDMSASTDVSSIPAEYHRALPLYATAQYFYKIEDTVNGDKFMERYLVIRQQAKADLGEKQAEEFTSVLEDSEQGFDLDNTFPQRGSLNQL